MVVMVVICRNLFHVCFRALTPLTKSWIVLTMSKVPSSLALICMRLLPLRPNKHYAKTYAKQCINTHVSFYPFEKHDHALKFAIVCIRSQIKNSGNDRKENKNTVYVKCVMMVVCGLSRNGAWWMVGLSVGIYTKR